MKDPVTVGDGKYTFFLAEDGLLDCLRHGEPWPAFREQGSHFEGSTLALYHSMVESARPPNKRINLGILYHDFALIEGELHCSDKTQILSEDVSLDVSTGEVMAWCQGQEYEVNLCEGCYEMVIAALVKEIDRLKSKKCPHDLAKEFMEGFE